MKKIKLIRELTIEETRIFIVRLLPRLGLTEAVIPKEKENAKWYLKEFRQFFRKWQEKEMLHAIQLAFDGEIKHELNMYGRSLNLPHLASLMLKYRAYREYKDKTIAKIHPNKHYTRFTDEDNHQANINSINEVIDAWNKYVCTGILPQPIVKTVYIINLKQIGLINEDEKINQDILNKALDKLLRSDKTSSLIKSELIQERTNHHLVSIAAVGIKSEYLIHEAFKKALHEDINVEQLLNKLKTNGKEN